MAKKKEESCGNCFYGLPFGNLAKCRRFPANSDGQGVHTRDEQPLMDIEGWCGEYKPINA